MTTRPRVLVVGVGDRDALVRSWLLECGADPVVADADVAAVVVLDAAASDPPAGLPVLDARGATREQVAEFVRRLSGRHTHTFDDHGSPEAWPRGSY